MGTWTKIHFIEAVPSVYGSCQYVFVSAQKRSAYLGEASLSLLSIREVLALIRWDEALCASPKYVRIEEYRGPSPVVPDAVQVRFYKLMIDYDTHERATFDLCQVRTHAFAKPHKTWQPHRCYGVIGILTTLEPSSASVM